jgi:hypothetical protein
MADDDVVSSEPSVIEAARFLIEPAPAGTSPMDIVAAARQVASAFIEQLEGLPERDRAVRKAERDRLAAWFEADQATIEAFSTDGLTVGLVAFLLRIDHE